MEHLLRIWLSHERARLSGDEKTADVYLFLFDGILSNYRYLIDDPGRPGTATLMQTAWTDAIAIDRPFVEWIEALRASDPDVAALVVPRGPLEHSDFPAVYAVKRPLARDDAPGTRIDDWMELVDAYNDTRYPGRGKGGTHDPRARLPLARAALAPFAARVGIPF